MVNFERMKEELREGKSLVTAIEEGFKRAWSSIRDSNISSLITCAILYWFGTGQVRGFAITLGIGILISMFTAITITKTFLRFFEGERFENKVRILFGVKKAQS
ncbi:preprotein translocase subunit SecD [Patescibacteria group bacterium]